MTYAKQTWVDGSGGGTPLSAARLNYIENGILAASNSDPVGTAAAAITAHNAAVDPHGDRAFATTTSGSAITTHNAAVDPHGDRAYVDAIFASANTIDSLSALTAASTAAGDEFLIDDVSAATTFKITVANTTLATNAQAQGVNAQTGTTYTIAAVDRGYLVTQSNGSAITTTFPQDSADTGIQIGAWGEIFQLGAGQITCSAGAGTTLRATPTAKTRAQYSRLFWQKISANTYSIAGDLAAS